MQDQDIHVLIGKQLAGEASEEECQFVEDWMNSSPANELTYLKLKIIWEETAVSSQDSLKVEVFSTISQAIKFEDEAVPAKHKSLEQQGIKWYAVAAAIVLMILSGWWVSTLLFEEQAPKQIMSEWVERSNPVGKRSFIRLPDSSTVYLNAESSIRYLKHFDSTIRLVQLKGEAFFDVKPNKEKPFVVESGLIKTTALGTSFNVSSYPEDEEIRVSLVSGQVSVVSEPLQLAQNQIDSAQLILNPGEEAMLNEDEQKLSKGEFDPDLVLAWKTGKLNMERADFQEIKTKLERWYRVKIEVKNAAKTGGTLTDSFTNESLEQVMEGISFAFGFKYKIQDKTVIIY